MKVYQPGTKGKRMLFAQPGKEFRVTHFLDENRNPKMFSITFVEGVADVEDQLGNYLVHKGLATRSPIIVPAGATS